MVCIAATCTARARGRPRAAERRARVRHLGRQQPRLRAVLVERDVKPRREQLRCVFARRGRRVVIAGVRAMVAVGVVVNIKNP